MDDTTRNVVLYGIIPSVQSNVSSWMRRPSLSPISPATRPSSTSLSGTRRGQPQELRSPSPGFHQTTRAGHRPGPRQQLQHRRLQAPGRGGDRNGFPASPQLLSSLVARQIRCQVGVSVRPKSFEIQRNRYGTHNQRLPNPYMLWHAKGQAVPGETLHSIRVDTHRRGPGRPHPIMRVNNSRNTTSTIFFEDGSMQFELTNEELAQKLGL